MQSPSKIASLIADRIVALPPTSGRSLIAIAGPPASGKTTVSSALMGALAERGVTAGLVAMDGYHLDNAILEARELRARKGAPETFDFAGFHSVLRRLQSEDEVIAATFDRARDVAVGSSAVIAPDMRTVIVEGNYLLLDEAPWAQLCPLWSLSVMISAVQKTLEARLVERWLAYGFSPQEARAKALENDIPNALRVLNAMSEPDMKIEEF